MMENRNIFRGIALVGDKFAYGQVVYEDGKPCIVGPVVEADSEYLAFEWWEPVIPETLGQCTGLTAAKSYRGESEVDRLVFEGDLFVPYYVDAMGRLAMGDPDYENKGMIVQVNGCFCLQRKNRNPIPMFEFLSYKHGDYISNYGHLRIAVSQVLNGEIISTIHEPPHLLEKEAATC